MQISFISDQKKEILPVSKARYTQKEHKKTPTKKKPKNKTKQINNFDQHLINT